MKSIYSLEYQSLLSKLIAARKAAGFTQQELADKLGRHQSFISKIETGERRMDVVEFLHIAHAIGFDPCLIIRQLEKA